MLFGAAAALVLACCIAAGCGDLATSGPTTGPTAAPVLPPGSTSSATATAATFHVQGTTTSDTRLAAYRDRRNRFILLYPATWRETSLRQLGDSKVSGHEIVGFADHDGPSENGCYLDFVQIDLLGEFALADEALERIYDVLPDTVDGLSKAYTGLEVVDSWRETQIAGSPAMTITFRGSINHRPWRLLECVFVAGECLYSLEFMAIEADWPRYEPIFREIMHGFTTEVS